MLIKQLAASNVRSLDFIQLAPIDGINVIVGKNNDGKTTLLESIYFASSLKSFKSVSSATLVKNGANSLKIQIKCSNVSCLLYTSDAADDTPCVDLGGRRIIKKKLSR